MTARLTILLLCLLLMASGCQSRQGQLKPIRPTATPGGVILGQVQAVTLTELNANPVAYQNRLVRVSGDYAHLPLPECAPTKGPATRWALITDNLRLDALGYEWVLILVPEGTTLTVEGVWRLYQGPLGCGKEPPLGVAWVLETVQIVLPNPLPRLAAVPLETPTAPTVPPIGATPEPTAEGGPPTAAVTPALTVTASRTPTGAGATPSLTPGLTAPPTRGMASATPSLTATIAAGTAVTPGTPAPTSSATTPTPLPPIATATPGGCGAYPCPTNPPPGVATPTNTPAPPPYP